MISITEEIAVPSPPGRVWQVISTPSDVVSCISGAELGQAHEDGSFDGTLVVKFGAVRVRFAARIDLELDEAAHEGRLTARGKDGQGATRFAAEATFRVTQGDGPSDARVAMSGEIKLNGRLAALVEAGASAVTARMTKDFSERLVKLCAEPLAPHEPATEAPATATAAGKPAPAASRTLAPAAPADRPRGLLGRLRAWWARLRDRPQKAPAEQAADGPTRSTAGASGGARQGEQK